METLPELSASLVPSGTWAQHNVVNQLLSGHSNKSRGRGVDVLNVTHMTSLRKDGHSSIYYLGPNRQAPLHRQDCSHWCLPGVPDLWNELLYALFLKREGILNQNSTHTRTQSVIKEPVHQRVEHFCNFQQRQQSLNAKPWVRQWRYSHTASTVLMVSEILLI